MKETMKSTIIFLTIFISNCSAVIYRKSYQDQTSWSFQHPTTTYTQARFEKDFVKSLGNTSINTDTLATLAGQYVHFTLAKLHFSEV